MSGTVLYLAIVAIWVCVLVPRWMRKSHPVAGAPGSSMAGETAEIEDDALAGAGPGVRVDTAVAMASATVTETVTETSHWRSAEPRIPLHRPLSSPQAPEYAESLTLTAESLTAESVTVTAEAPPRPGADPVLTPASPSLSRAQTLQARRRLLSTLLTLAAVAAAFTVIGLASWWVCIPPIVMLGIYLPLLRAAALTDAKNQRRRQEAILAYAARQRAQALQAARAAQAAREALAARAPEPRAEIIDISGRVHDQLYDQYADAAVRAVGD